MRSPLDAFVTSATDPGAEPRVTARYECLRDVARQSLLPVKPLQ
jgi:hypothetical protein